MKNNPVGWFEIYVEDMARSKAFYETVLGVKLETMGTSDAAGISEMCAFPMEREGAGAAGALVKMEGGPTNGNSTIVYFTSEDCAIETKRVAAAGGQVMKAKFSIGRNGFIALVKDPEGHVIGLHSQK